MQPLCPPPVWKYHTVKSLYGVRFSGSTSEPRSEMRLSHRPRLFLAMTLSLSNLGVWVKLVLTKDFCTLGALSKCTMQAGKEVCNMLLEEQLGSCLAPGFTPSCASV